MSGVLGKTPFVLEGSVDVGHNLTVTGHFTCVAQRPLRIKTGFVSQDYESFHICIGPLEKRGGMHQKTAHPKDI